MKFLIVNDLGQVGSSLRVFDRFTSFVTKSQYYDRLTCDDDTEIIIAKKHDDLIDYLFDVDEGYVTDNSAKRFDKIDAVFIVSSSNKVVWSNANRKVCFFLYNVRSQY